jgi:two-component system alkaline phosphatase synthesis response regulator PhoP
MERETLNVDARKTLAVDDEEDVLELLEYNLSKEGFRVLRVKNGEDALELARSEKPDLILLDLMLPGLDGLEVCRHLKGDRETAGIPIVMLTAKGEEADIVPGLEMGAEDYVTKPFSPRVLAARVRAVLRRQAKGATDEHAPIRISGIEIHQRHREVLAGGKPVRLTFSEYEILLFLARRPGWVFTRDEIVEAVRGTDYAVTDRSVDVQIVGRWRKRGEYGNNIETVRRIGYRFKEPSVGED